MGKLKSFFASADSDNLFRLDGAVPLSRAIPFGIQHVLSMFVANIVPLLIVFAMIRNGVDSTTIDSATMDQIINNGIRSAIFIAAIGTCVQLYPIWRIGSKLPIVVGLSFTFVSVLGLVGATYGMGTMFVSIIIGGLFIGVLGLFAKYWRRFIKPIVAACVVLGIGLSLLVVGIQEFIQYSTVITNTGATSYDFSIGWPYITVAVIGLVSSLLFKIFVPGVWKNINILVGLVVGYIAALCFNIVDFSAFQSLDYGSVATYVNVPWPVFVFQEIDFRFNFGAILSVCIIYLVASTEGIGDISSLANAGLGRDPTDKEISGGLACDGFVSALGGCFGALPLTTFSQNVGIVGQTKVVNRFTILQGAIFLFIASLFPMVSTFLMTIPDCVLGGCMVMLFASIVVIGMQMLSKCGFGSKNVTIASLAIGLGYGITLVPQFFAGDYSNLPAVQYLMLIIQNPVANMFVISLLLSFILPDKMDKEEKLKATVIEPDEKRIEETK